MNQKGPCINLHNHPHFRMVMVLASCLTLVFSLLFAFSYASELADTNRTVCDIRHDAPSFAISDCVVNVDQPGDFPNNSPTPLEPPVPDESTSNDNLDDESGKLCWSLFFEQSFNPGAAKSLFSQLVVSLESRPKVFLVILHHSWKSFLS